jgi:adenylate kinase
LIEYYSSWANHGDAKAKVPAPKYSKVHGTGSVEDITGRVFAALED